MSAEPAPHAVELRAATPADEPALLAAFAASREAELAVMPGPEIAEQFAISQLALQRRMYAQAHPALEELAIVDGERDVVVGRLLLSLERDHLRLVDIALVADARGRGIGRAVVEQVQAIASGAGVPVVLHVEHDRPARRLYERLGFRVEAEDQVRARMRWEPPGA